ncbi:hypothetical protein N8Z47_03500 [Salibacteraceae bacterium]|nr:hypothetical protein [Salibacteraceae bacterium]
MKEIITIKRGPQFGGRLTIVILVASVVMFFTGVNNLSENPFLSLLFFGGTVLIMPIFLDYRGIQIDLKNSQVRKYKSYLGFYRGEWISLVGFDEVELKWERLRYRSGTSLLAMQATGSALSMNQVKTSDVYVIYLVDFLNGHRYDLADFSTYKGAKKFMYKYSKKLNLRPNDTYKILQDKAMERRNQIESRRRR